MSCTHLGEIQVTAPPAEVEGAKECLKTGGRWVDLRLCEVCAQIGCCDQ